MIRTTHATNPRGVLSAYRDNAAVVEGAVAGRLLADPGRGEYRVQREPVHTLMKVETHNHPTAISPFPAPPPAPAARSATRARPGAARGRRRASPASPSRTCACRISSSPGKAAGLGRPRRIVSPLQIMLEGPIGAAAFNNEFGRPNIAGYFRTFEQPVPASRRRAWGYHKPIMIAGRPRQHPRRRTCTRPRCRRARC